MSVDTAKAVATQLAGPILLCKGQQDTLWTLEAEGATCTAPELPASCPKRCGGQGDVLTGILGAAVSWSIAHCDAEAWPHPQMKQSLINKAL